MGTTQIAIVNTALELAKSQDLLTGGSWPNFVGSTTQGGIPVVTAANVLYGPVRDLLLRQINPEFGRVTITAAQASASPPISPWLYEYLYPADGLRIRQVAPPKSGTGALADPNDPAPIRAAVAFDIRSPMSKVVLTNQANALLVYTSNLPPEAMWDPDFAEAMARRLGNYFAMALAGRPDFARELLEESERYSSLSMENTDL